MATKIARNDAVVQQQVTTATPTVVNSAVYDLLINGKNAGSYTADGSATAQEIVEGYEAIVEANALSIPEYEEMVWTEDNTKVIATGLATGKPFTLVEGPGNGNWTLAVATVAKSPNHWIAENFDTLALPGADDVIIQGLTESQSFLYGLDQNGITLTSLDIRADSQAMIGLSETNSDNNGGFGNYYQALYRDTHLHIGITTLKIGDGTGQGARRIKLLLKSGVDCAATIYRTSTNSFDQDEAPVHIAGGTAASSMQIMVGRLDLAMLPGYVGSWGTIVASGSSVVRCGTGVTLATIEAAGNSVIESRSAVVTARTREGGQLRHIGAGNITTLDIQGGSVEVQATGTLTIAQLNGYGGCSLDLSNCDSLVTLTATTIYATPNNPFTIKDPNNKLVMTAAASTPNGATSLIVKTGSGRNVRIT